MFRFCMLLLLALCLGCGPEVTIPEGRVGITPDRAKNTMTSLAPGVYSIDPKLVLIIDPGAPFSSSIVASIPTSGKGRLLEAAQNSIVTRNLPTLGQVVRDTRIEKIQIKGMVEFNLPPKESVSKPYAFANGFNLDDAIAASIKRALQGQLKEIEVAIEKIHKTKSSVDKSRKQADLNLFVQKLISEQLEKDLFITLKAIHDLTVEVITEDLEQKRGSDRARKAN